MLERKGYQGGDVHQISDKHCIREDTNHYVRRTEVLALTVKSYVKNTSKTCVREVRGRFG